MDRRFAVAILLFASLQAPALADAQTRYVEYVVKRGDTCASIATQAYGDAARYDLIHAANDLGEPPHNLKPGQKLQLPKVPQALLARERGRVLFRPPTTDWSPAAVGLELFRAWQLNTLAQARALVEFRDDSQLLMRENTLVIIHGPKARDAGKTAGRVELQSGALRARLAELQGRPTIVETPSATTSVASADIVLTTDDKDATRLANHKGSAVELTSKSGGRVAVDAGFGSKVERGKRPTPPHRLPPAPKWKPGARRFGTFDMATVGAQWEPVSQASEYFVEVTADELGVRVIQSAFVASSVSALRIEGLEPGTYYATVSAVDDDKFEGLPSERLAISVVRFGFSPRNRLNDEPLRFVAGTNIDAPEGLRCGIGDEEPTQRVVLRAPEGATTEGNFPGHVQPTQMTCRDADGKSTTFAVEIETPAFELTGDEVRQGAVHLSSDETVNVVVTFTPVAVPLEVSAEGADAQFVPIDGNRGVIRLTRTAKESTSSALRLNLGPRLLAEVPVVIEHDSIAIVPQRRMVDINIGAAVQSGGKALRDDGAAATFVGTRLGIGVLAGSAFRGGLTIDAGALLADSPDAAFAIGAEAVLTWPRGRLRPFLGAGIGGWFADADLTASSDVSVGLDWHVGESHIIRAAGRGTLFGGPLGPLIRPGGFVGYARQF